MAPETVAIIGGGYSGLAAFWAMRQSQYNICLFEACERLGSLTKSSTCRVGDREWKVDTALNIYHPPASPNLLSFLRALGLSYTLRWFSFSSSRDRGRIEWSWGKLKGFIFCLKNLWRNQRWKVFLDTVRFNYFVVDVLRNRKNAEQLVETHGGIDNPPNNEMTIREYLEQGGYSRSFRVNYVIPLLRVLWNVDDMNALELPIEEFACFLWNNKLLSVYPYVSGWMNIAGGNVDFLHQINMIIPSDKVRLNTRITSVNAEPDSGLFSVRTEHRTKEVFERVIFAVPGHEALKLLSSDASNRERDILGGFHSQKGIGVLHTDEDFMPKTEENWATVNYIVDRVPPTGSTARSFISYDVTLLQRTRTEPIPPAFVTLNPVAPPNPLLVQDIWEYSRPIFNTQALASQRALPQIQNTRGISYCGSWTGYGYPEDGVRSAFMVATEHFGIELPFLIKDPSAGTLSVANLTKTDRLIRMLLTFLYIYTCTLGLIMEVVSRSNPFRRKPVSNGIPDHEKED